MLLKQKLYVTPMCKKNVHTEVWMAFDLKISAYWTFTHRDLPCTVVEQLLISRFSTRGRNNALIHNYGHTTQQLCLCLSQAFELRKLIWHKFVDSTPKHAVMQCINVFPRRLRFAHSSSEGRTESVSAKLLWMKRMMIQSFEPGPAKLSISCAAAVGGCEWTASVQSCLCCR